MYNPKKYNVVTIDTYDQALTSTLISIAKGLEGNVLFVTHNVDLARRFKFQFFNDYRNVLVFGDSRGSDVMHRLERLTIGTCINHIIFDDIDSRIESYISYLNAYGKLRGIADDICGVPKSNIYIGRKALRMPYDPHTGTDY